MAVKSKDLQKLGWPPGTYYQTALAAADAAHKSGVSKSTVLDALKKVYADPEPFARDPIYAELANALIGAIVLMAPSGPAED